MDEKNKRRLIEGWISLYKNYRERGTDDAFFWAYTELDGICRNQPLLALELVNQIIWTDKSDTILENLAAGPLEDLLARHGEDLIDRVEEYAKANPHFKALLGGVWRNAIPEKVWERIQKVSGEKW